MGKRQIKKTVVRYEQTGKKANEPEMKEDREERSRSRQKEGHQGNHKEQPVKVQEMNVNSRRARLEAMRKARQQQEEELQQSHKSPQIEVKIEEPEKMRNASDNPKPSVESKEEVSQKGNQDKNKIQEQHNSSEGEPNQNSEEEEVKVIRKPVFVARQFRDQNENDDQLKEEERKRKNVRYTTKMLLEQQKYEGSEEENELTDSEDENNPDGINDDDTTDEELQFQLWKIRELNRIRKALEEKRKHEVEKAEIDRRRLMSNEAILIENKELGSDANQGEVETKYTFMQKYYHKGAFYQDNDDEVFNRDYNLPTPMEMQDKSLLPQILQKRVGNFGKKGQSKYTHLTNEDTSDLNPLTRPDESLLEFWKRRTAGYKGSYGKNI